MRDKIQVPNNKELEETYLGILLSYPEYVGDGLSYVNSQCFYHIKNQIIFEVINDLHNNQINVDIITVTDRLKRDDNLDKVGGAYYITTLMTNGDHAYNLQQYGLMLTEYSIRRDLIKTGQALINNGHDQTKDVLDTLGTVQTNLFNIDKHNTVRQPVMLNDSVNSSFERLKELDGIEGGLTGVGTGFSQLDRHTGGWQKGDLIIVAARPSMGKTALALSLARNASYIHKKSSVIFSFEMSHTQLSTRLLTSEARVDSQSIRQGRGSSDDWEKMGEARDRLQNCKILIDDNAESTIQYVISQIRKKKAEGYELFIVDYLQLMTNPGLNKNSNREQEIASMSRLLKKTALELDVPIILLCQLSRKVEGRPDKKPMLSDLRESGAIEQDADIVMFIYRPEKYGIMVDEEGRDLTGISQILFEKYRNGSTGIVELTFIEQYARFENLEKWLENDNKITTLTYLQPVPVETLPWD